MAQIIDMPKLSDTMTVGTLVKWKKKEGDAAKSGDMLAEVETDKAVMELVARASGTLIRAAGGRSDPEGSISARAGAREGRPPGPCAAACRDCRSSSRPGSGR